MDFDRYDHIRLIRWHDGTLSLLDQRKLPFTVQFLDCRSSHDVSQAIRDLVVRGAPAIGIAAAFGVVLAADGVDAATGSAAMQVMETRIVELNAALLTTIGRSDDVH